MAGEAMVEAMTTTRSLERRGAFTAICMAVAILVVLAMWIASAIAEPATSRSFSSEAGKGSVFTVRLPSSGVTH